MNTIEINKSIWINKDAVPTHLVERCGYETKNKIDIYPLLNEYTIFDVIQTDNDIRLFANGITLDEIIVLKVMFNANEVGITNYTFCEDGIPIESIQITLS